MHGYAPAGTGEARIDCPSNGSLGGVPPEAR